VGIALFLSHMHGSIVAVQPCVGEAYGKVLRPSALLSCASLLFRVDRMNYYFGDLMRTRQ
jgi:hypothetical protein